MRVTCISCSESIELDGDANLQEIHCPHCGYDFEFPVDATLSTPGPQGESLSTLVPGETIAEFRLLRKICSKSGTEVWKARSDGNHQDVALKLARATASGGDHTHAFDHEASILRVVGHPGIAGYVAHGVDANHNYLATEFVDGVTISEWLRQRCPTAHQAAQFISKISSIVSHLHGKSVVHRDLSGGNVLVGNSDQDLHLIDFGIAVIGKAGSDSPPQAMTGTPCYMAPEQISGETGLQGPPSDVYALGVLFYELLTGSRPFHPGIDAFNDILSKMPPSPKVTAPSVPTGLSDICMTCLMKSPDDRYSDASELREALDQALMQAGQKSGGRSDISAISERVVPKEHAAFEFRIIELEEKLEKRSRALMATKAEYDIYQTLVESLPIGVYRTDLNGRFVFKNEYFDTLLQTPELSMQIENHCKQGDEQVRTTADVMRSNESAGTISLDVIRSPVRNLTGRIVGVQGLMFDVSGHAEVENTLKKEKEDAIAANQAKNEFLARMSHEIRTPMTAIIGMHDILLSSALATEQIKSVRTIGEASKSLLQIVDDILDYSKVETGHLRLDQDQFSVRSTCQQVIDLLLDSAESKGLQLEGFVETGVPDAVVGDAFRIRQCLINLVGNSIKFTSSGEVKIYIRCERKTAEICSLKITVHDSGPGIPATQLTRILEPFEQADTSLSRVHTGTGLGLAIVSRVVELMNGKLTIESEIGVGSQFTLQLELPLAAERPSEPVQQSPQEAAILRFKRSGPKKILVVDDVEANRAIIEHILANAGSSPDTAESGPDAIQHAGRLQYDIILMDVQMPAMDGYEASDHIRNPDNLNSDTPIIALTAHAMDGYREECLRRGMNGYVRKPIDCTELLSEIDRLLIKRSDQTNPSFSYEAFCRQLGGDTSSANHCIALLKSNLPEMLCSIENTIHLSGTDEFDHHVHRLRGALSNLLGSDTIGPIPTLDKLSRQATTAETDVALEKLRQEIEVLEQELIDSLEVSDPCRS